MDQGKDSIIIIKGKQVLDEANGKKDRRYFVRIVES